MNASGARTSDYHIRHEIMRSMEAHLLRGYTDVDGTYELLRHFYGLRRLNKGVDLPF